MTDPMITEGGSNAGKVLGILLAAVVLLGLAGGAIVLITASGDDGGGDDNEASADAPDDEPATTTTEAVDASPSSTQPPTTTTAPLPLDLLRNDPSPAVEAWYDAVGREAQAIQVILYPTYAFLDVRDPERPGSLVEYVWRDGVLDGPTPEPIFPGTDLDAESYRLSQVNWDAVPGLVAAAPERAGLPQGEVTHVIIESDLPFSSRFVMRIYVTAPNGASDYVVATIDGQPADR